MCFEVIRVILGHFGSFRFIFSHFQSFLIAVIFHAANNFPWYGSTDTRDMGKGIVEFGVKLDRSYTDHFLEQTKKDVGRKL